MNTDQMFGMMSVDGRASLLTCLLALQEKKGRTGVVCFSMGSADDVAEELRLLF